MRLISTAALLLFALPALAQQKPADKPAAVQHKDKDGKPELVMSDALRANFGEAQANIARIQAQHQAQAMQEAMQYNIRLASIISEVLAENPDFTWHVAQNQQEQTGFFPKSDIKDLRPGPGVPPPPSPAAAAPVQPAPGPTVKAEPAKK